MACSRFSVASTENLKQVNVFNIGTENVGKEVSRFYEKAFHMLCAFLQKMLSIKRIYILGMLMFCYLIPDWIQIVLLNFCFLFISWRQDKNIFCQELTSLETNLNFLSKINMREMQRQGFHDKYD